MVEYQLDILIRRRCVAYANPDLPWVHRSSRLMGGGGGLNLLETWRKCVGKCRVAVSRYGAYYRVFVVCVKQHVL